MIRQLELDYQKWQSLPSCNSLLTVLIPLRTEAPLVSFYYLTEATNIVPRPLMTVAGLQRREKPFDGC